MMILGPASSSPPLLYLTCGQLVPAPEGLQDPGLLAQVEQHHPQGPHRLPHQFAFQVSHGEGLHSYYSI